HRPVAGDVAALRQERQGEDAFGQLLRGGDAHGRRQRAAAVAQLAAQGGAVLGHGHPGRGRRCMIAAAAGRAKPATVPARTKNDASRGRRRRKNGSPPCRCGETTLNPRFKWERSETFGLPATWRTCTPGVVASPVSFLRDKANVLPAVEHGRERGRIIASPRALPSLRGVNSEDSGNAWFRAGRRGQSDRAFSLVVCPWPGRAGCPSAGPGCPAPAPARARGRRVPRAP